MSDWVSIDRATIDTHRTYEVMLPNGDIDTRTGRTVCKQSAVAVRDVTPPKPKRRTWHVKDSSTFYGTLDLREVLPGDCDPDVVREVAAEMRNVNLSTVSMPTVLINQWVDRLEGK
jgi:hypothetical protein